MIVLYSAGPSLDFVLNALQQIFLNVQQAFSTLNLVMNTSKTKVIWFGKNNSPLPTGVITTSEGLELEVVTSLQELGCMARRYTVLLSAHIKAASYS